MTEYIVDDIICLDQAPDNAAVALESATPISAPTGAWDNTFNEELMEIAFQAGDAWLLKRITNGTIKFWLYPKTCAFSDLAIQGHTEEEANFTVFGQAFTATVHRVQQAGTGVQATLNIRH